MCSCLLFYIATTQPGYCSDGRCEHFPGEFDEFYAFAPLVSFLWWMSVFTFPLLATQTCVSLKTFGHVIKLMLYFRYALTFGYHYVDACV
jgi:hypothetical protein